jgi:multiple sugar transport system substrate-binding protein
MVEDRLLPTEEDKLAMASDLSQGYSLFAQFDYGRYGMVLSGHWAFIMLRPRGDFELAAVPPPAPRFPNTEIGSGGIGVYRGSRHPELAARFMQFLTSEPFNRLIVQQADSLPPVPRFAHSEEFLHPVGRENEWPVHAAFAAAQETTGLLSCRSPFVLRSVVWRLEKEIFEAVVAGRLTAEQGARQMAARINAEIALGAQRDERRRARFAELTALQARIEAARAAGERVPTEWILSPFHRAYYRAQGWLREEGETTP